jgi:hypothetical protein
MVESDKMMTEINDVVVRELEVLASAAPTRAEQSAAAEAKPSMRRLGGAQAAAEVLPRPLGPLRYRRSRRAREVHRQAEAVIALGPLNVESRSVGKAS